MSSYFQDKEMILIACANSFGEALKFVDESFYKEKDFMIQVVFFQWKQNLPTQET